jgi:transcriptional regulator with XRE-family HTH domain
MTMTKRTTTGARLRAAREQAGMTVAEAALRLGLPTRRHLKHIEAGNRSGAILDLAAALYGVTLESLMIGPTIDPEDPARAARHRRFVTDAQLERLAPKLKRLRPRTPARYRHAVERAARVLHET